MSRTNKTLNSQDNVYGLEKYPANYNVRKFETPKAVTGLKAKYFDRFNKCEDEKSYLETKDSYLEELKNEVKGVKL